ncbi:hypothetical protein YC2023_099940 [Brassica napus]
MAKFELKKTLTMVIVFSLTAPVEIGIGIGIAEIYYKNGPTTLILSGFLHAAAAGMLLFMAGVTGYNLKPHSTLHMLKALGWGFELPIQGLSSSFLHSITYVSFSTM